MTSPVLPAIPAKSAATASRARTFPSCYTAWQAHSLSSRAAATLASAGIDTVEQVAHGRVFSKDRRNLGTKTLHEPAEQGACAPELRKLKDEAANNDALDRAASVDTRQGPLWPKDTPAAQAVRFSRLAR